MKKIVYAFISLSLLFSVLSCDKKLPYPYDEVKRGVLIDVARVADTEGVLYDGITTGNYKIKLTIPENQGDYSHMKHAQLVAVLEGLDKKRTSQVIIDNITQFPQEITLNIGDICSKFGQKAPIVGQIFFLTANVVLNDGLVIPGWTAETGFNNVAFAGWWVDGRLFSSNVRYAVVCALNLDDFVGPCKVIGDFLFGDYPAEIVKTSATELNVKGFCDGEARNPLIIKVNLADYSVTIPQQVLEPDSHLWWGNTTYTNFSLGNGTGSIDACNRSISFTATATVGAGSFGARAYKIVK